MGTLKAITVLGWSRRTARRQSIVYVERADGDGEQIAAFEGNRRSAAVAYSLYCNSVWSGNVLLVEDEDVAAWPEILEGFDAHATGEDAPRNVARWRLLRRCAAKNARRTPCEKNGL